MGSHVSREGISRDLESLASVGMSGVQLFQLADMTTAGVAPIVDSPFRDQPVYSERWWSLVGHAVAECDRLGMRLWLHNSAGWSAGGGPWIGEEFARKKLAWTTTPVTGGGTWTGEVPPVKPTPQTSHLRDIAVVAVPADGPVAMAATIDLTSRVAADGTVTWPTPPGEWTIYRFAEVVHGGRNGPTAPEASGWMFDHLDAEASRFHLQHVLQRIEPHAGRFAGGAWQGICIDSFDTHDPPWCRDFERVVRDRIGLDLVPWLVTYAGRTVASEELTSRCRRQLERVRQELLRDNLYGTWRRMLHDRVLELLVETHVAPVPEVATAEIDIPQVEFWAPWRHVIKADAPGAARAFGRREVFAEAWTAFPEDSPWTESPASLKAAGDAAFAAGVTRMCLHSVPHQPFTDPRFRPGMTMGWWGSKFGPQQTWWEPGKAWLRYLARCQALLAFGETPAAAVVLGSQCQFPVSLGYRLDFVDELTLSKARVIDSRIVLSSGRTYALLVLPKTGVVSRAAARAIRRLATEGGAVMGVPWTAATELVDHEQADAEVARIGLEMWGTSDQQARVSRMFGAGRIFNVERVDAALAALGVKPELEVQSEAGQIDALRFIRRKGARLDAFFLTNTGSQSLTVDATFAATGTPQLWQPLTGQCYRLPAAKPDAAEGTRIPLTIGPGEAFFVVFHANPPTDHERLPAETFRRHERVAAIEGPWDVVFPSARSDGTDVRVTWPKLRDWTTDADADIRHFSGTATYRTTFQLEARRDSGPLHLDLGDVAVIAHVRLNGEEIGTAWCLPWRLDASRAIRPGRNVVEIEVTNCWANRLIGDEAFPDDVVWGKEQLGLTRKIPIGRPLAAWPEWFLEKRPRPVPERRTLTTWKYHRPDSPLQPSGLHGPVAITAPVP